MMLDVGPREIMMKNPWREKEQEYLETLEHERHMFAWCLEHIGNLPKNIANEQAMAFYAYEPASAENRGLVFHDEAWHWAMLRIKGDGYWQNNRQIERPSEDYNAESRLFDAGKQRNNA